MWFERFQSKQTLDVTCAVCNISAKYDSDIKKYWGSSSSAPAHMT